VPQPSSAAAGGPLTLALTLIGCAALVITGRQLLAARPLPTPDTPPDRLERTRRWDPDPERRREAALLLTARGGDPARQRSWLRGQGWGEGSLAPVALKLDALAAEASGRRAEADRLWRQLERRFPAAPSTADALYALGRSDPSRRAALLRRFPAHPAALAAAVETGGTPDGQRGALHLARWGARWPGAEALLRQTCRRPLTPLTTAQRRQLATGLAQLGDGAAALACLGGGQGDAATELAVGTALLKGPGAQALQGEERLVALTRRWPAGPEALEAGRQLSQLPDPRAKALLPRLGGAVAESAPVRARLAELSGVGWRPVLSRWPGDPASWDLQWELARRHLLQGRWAAAAAMLTALGPERLPAPLAARQLFWLGFVQERQGQPAAARQSWERLLERHPWGYYAWRARVRLGRNDPPLRLLASDGTGGQALAERPWQPLSGGWTTLRQLWRLGLPLESWEHWRHRRRNTIPLTAPELALEGRLRQGVGDDWTSLGQLERASLRWSGGSCAATLPLERALHPIRFGPVFTAAAASEGLDPTLLLAVAKQESRFSPGVGSVAGAIGLLQLMPATAAELAGGPITAEELRRPERNVPLGARYLQQLLGQWRGDPFLAVASYNAGPGAVQGWIDARLREAPELWVEAIPYPETRLYVKKVLGNLWSYQELPRRGC
jgi:soluble lytic murein transglycosylase